MLSDWSLELRDKEDSCIQLGLVSVICISGDLIYIYGNNPLNPEATPALSLPQALTELLLRTSRAPQMHSERSSSAPAFRVGRYLGHSL